MKNRDSIFQLIHSLTKNEKGYFKKYISKYSSVKDKQNSYVKLFDAIEKQTEYDESKLKKKFANDNLGKHLAVSKNYLYNAILKSLRSYYQETSTDVTIRLMLRDGDILFQKALFDDYEDILHKAKKLAQKSEKFLLLLAIYGRFFRLNTVLGKDKKDYERIIHEDYEEQMKAIDQYKNILEYRQLSAQLHALTKGGYEGDLRENKGFMEIVNSPLLKENINLPSYRAGTYYYNILGLIYGSYLHDNQKAYEINSKYASYIESNALFLDEEPSNYVIALNNLMIYQQNLNKFDEYKATLKKLSTFKVKDTNLEISIYSKVVMIELCYYIRTNKIKEGIEFFEKHEPLLKVYFSQINKSFLIAILDSVYILYFINESYSKALNYVNKLINEKLTIREDIICFAHMFYLFIHFEMKNFDHIEYIIRSTERFINNKKGLTDFEKELIKFFRFVVDATSENAITKELQNLKQNVERFKNDDSCKIYFDFFNVEYWVNSKLEKRKYSDVAPKLHT